jgi:hypothetical protein
MTYRSELREAHQDYAQHCVSILARKSHFDQLGWREHHDWSTHWCCHIAGE